MWTTRGVAPCDDPYGVMRYVRETDYDAICAELAQAQAQARLEAEEVGTRFIAAVQIAYQLIQEGRDARAEVDKLAYQLFEADTLRKDAERLFRVRRFAEMLRDPRQWIQNEYTTRISRELDAALDPARKAT
jgi:hypothetical protein